MIGPQSPTKTTRTTTTASNTKPLTCIDSTGYPTYRIGNISYSLPSNLSTKVYPDPVTCLPKDKFCFVINFLCFN